MTPRDLLELLAQRGLTAYLKLRLEGESPPPDELRDLIARHRDDLIIHLAGPLGSTPEMCRLSEQLDPGAVWCKRCYRYQQHPCFPTDKVMGPN